MLSYINIRGCSGLSDMALAAFLRRCSSIHSLLVCYTCFGKDSVKVLCSDVGWKPISCPTIASRLQCLRLDGCRGELFLICKSKENYLEVPAQHIENLEDISLYPHF
jgi:hypothetical protein